MGCDKKFCFAQALGERLTRVKAELDPVLICDCFDGIDVMRQRRTDHQT
jgi:hypothetical protein